MRVRLESLGCRLNIAEIEEMARQLAAAGHELVGAGETADLCIFNSCTVTAVASRKSRHIIRQLRRANPDARVVVTGCYAELSPEEVRALGVDRIAGNQDKGCLLDILREEGVLTPATAQACTLVPGEVGRTRAFLKVQEGCDQRCTYCVVTLARGPALSRPIAEVVAEVEHLHGLGYQEVVLTGVHLGSYGHDHGDRHGLRHLIQRLLADTDLPRLRLSSLEPWDVDPTLIQLFADPRLLPHLHLPVQSGCETILGRMGRPTTLEGTKRLLAEARASVPDISISTDVMVAFPGESDEHFEESLTFVEEAAFSRLHVFRFSPRAGTAAASFAGQVQPPIAQERSQRMLALGSRLAERFNRRFVGRTLRALWETGHAGGDGTLWSGLTDNYIRVECHSEQDLHNRITEVGIVELAPGGVRGRLVEDDPRRA